MKKRFAQVTLSTLLVIFVIGSAPVWGPLVLLYFGMLAGIAVLEWLLNHAFSDDPKRRPDCGVTDVPRKAVRRLPEGLQSPSGPAPHAKN